MGGGIGIGIDGYYIGKRQKVPLIQYICNCIIENKNDEFYKNILKLKDEQLDYFLFQTFLLTAIRNNNIYCIKKLINNWGHKHTLAFKDSIIVNQAKRSTKSNIIIPLLSN